MSDLDRTNAASAARLSSADALQPLPARLGLTGGLEVLLGALVLAAAAYQLWFVLNNGYLAQPFFYDTLDTLMDFHNTSYWAHAEGAYAVWNSIYPPLSFALLKLLTPAQCYAVDGFIGRDCNPSGFAALLVGVLALVAVLWRLTAGLHPGVRVARVLATALGLPVLFGLERGNLVLWAIPAALWALTRPRGDWPGAISLAFAINLKPYLLVLLLPLVLAQGWRGPWRVLLACAGIYGASVLLVGDGMPWHLLRNMQSFVGEGAINYWEKFYFSTSFSPLVRTLTSELPVHNYLDGKVIDAMLLAMTSAQRLGLLLFGLAMLLSPWVPRHLRSLPLLSALTLGAALVATESFGGYTLALLTSLVFAVERNTLGTRPAAVLAVLLTGAYLLSLPFDYIVVTLREFEAPVWISGGEVEVRYGVAVGQILRPALVLLVQCLLAALCLRQAMLLCRTGLQRLSHRPPAPLSN